MWYRNPSQSEVIGRCGGDEKTNDHAEPKKGEREKNNVILTLSLKKTCSRDIQKLKKVNLEYHFLNLLKKLNI